jgi:hypothetical protein
MPDSTRRRLYSEPEIRDILQRAAKMQDEATARPTSGLSADELEHIGEEVGIDPRFIREALAARAAQDTPLSEHNEASRAFWGAPASLEIERVVEGEVTEDEWTEIVARLRRTYGGPGRQERLGRAFEWSHTLPNTTDKLHVSLSPKDGQTRIRFALPNQNAIGGFGAVGFAFAFFGGLIALPLAEVVPEFFALLSGVVAVASVVMLTRYAIAKHFARRERIAGEVLRDLEDLIEPTADPAYANVPEVATETVADPAAPLPLGLGGVEAGAGAAEAAPRRVRS